MLTYCLVCKKNTENKDAKMIKTKNGRLYHQNMLFVAIKSQGL